MCECAKGNGEGGATRRRVGRGSHGDLPSLPRRGGRPLCRGGLSCVRVRAWLSVAIASWFLVGGAARLTGCFFSPEHVRARPPARARPNLTPLGALPLIPTTPGSEILAVPSRYVQPRHPLPRPSVRPSVRLLWREGRDLRWRRGVDPFEQMCRASEQAYGLHSLPKRRNPAPPHCTGCPIREVARCVNVKWYLGAGLFR